jgi:small-conductance mechanosensitive channel
MFCNTGGFLKKLPLALRQLIPTLIMIGLVALAGGTDVFSKVVHDLVSKSLHQRVAEFMPYAINLMFVLIFFNIAYVLFHPLSCGVQRVLGKTDATERGKQLATRAFKLVYWSVIVIFVLSLFAQELMGKFVLGFSVLGAALTLAMQGAASDFIAGWMMQFSRRVRVGDDIKVLGSDGPEGKVLDVDYVQTVLETTDGVVTVPNRQMWEKAVKVKKPEPSKLILPEGFVRTPATDAAKTEKKGLFS